MKSIPLFLARCKECYVLSMHNANVVLEAEGCKNNKTVNEKRHYTVNLRLFDSKYSYVLHYLRQKRDYFRVLSTTSVRKNSIMVELSTEVVKK